MALLIEEDTMELTGNNNAIERTASQAHQTVDELARRATDTAGPAIDRVARAAHQTVDKVAQAAHPAAEWIGDSAERVKQTQDQMVTSARDYIRARPLLTLGVALAAVCARFIKTMLFGVSTIDPRVYAIAGGLLMASALLASYLPARRAARVDPLVSLRAE